MNLCSFKQDIDELILEFVKGEFTSLADMKRIWLSRKFSYIFQASPKTNHGFFMQTLYAHSIGHMVSGDSLSRRLGGLYCLYCLYETQPFKPPFKIYLSLGELRKLRSLVVEAKQQEVKVVPTLVKRMLEKNLFLFGSVDLNEGSKTVNQFTELQNARLKFAHDKLFGDTRIEQFLHMDMGMEFDLDMLKKMSADYAEVKKQAIKEAGEIVDVQNIQHMSDDKETIGDTAEKITQNWNAQRELFYKQIGLNQHPAEKELQNPNQDRQVGEDDEFSHELELQLHEDEGEQEMEFQKPENEDFSHALELQQFSQLEGLKDQDDV